MVNTKKLQIIWTQQTASIIANSSISGEPPKGFDPETGSTTFEEITALGTTDGFLFVTVPDGTEYGYPSANIGRIKLTEV